MIRLFSAFTLAAAWFSGCAPSLDAYKALAMEGRIDSSAGAVGRAVIEVRAPPEVVWSRLVKAEEWPLWNPEVKSMVAEGDLDSGALFAWGPGFPKIKSEVVIAKPERELVWIGSMLHLKAIHRWTLAEKDGSTLVFTEESLEGAMVPLLFGKEKLEGSLGKWLASLKTRSEMDFRIGNSGSRMTGLDD